MATGVSSIQTRPLRPSFPSRYYFSLFKPSPMALSSRSVVAYSKAFHRREVCKIQSSLDSFPTRSPFQHRQEASYLSSPSIERKSVPGGFVSDSLKLGDKKSWKEETESMRKYRGEGTAEFDSNGVLANTKEDAVINGKNNNNHRQQIYRKNFAAEAKPSLKDSLFKAQSPSRSNRYDFTASDARQRDDTYHDGGGVKLGLLETPKSTVVDENMVSEMKKFVELLKRNEISNVGVNKTDGRESESFGEPALSSTPKQVYEDITENIVKKKDLSIREQLCSIYSEVLVVDNISVAKKVVEKLTKSYRHLVHACDTEVAKIDVKAETPVDHGEIICFSIYCGPEADFGNGKSCVWVDVLDGGGKEILNEFALFFEDPSIKKVWHNYSFDNHIVENYGIKVSGFHADTMHMARLWDSSRRALGGYSLEALTGDPKVMSGAELPKEKKLYGKLSMKTIFGKKNLKKDGTEGKLSTIAAVEELQRGEERVSWISYSALDAMTTLKLYESLRRHLTKRSLRVDGRPVNGKSMFDFYVEYWRPFGELLVKMEAEGMLVDREHLAGIEKLAKSEQELSTDRFRTWASKYCPDAKYMNIGSDTQLRQLLFGGIANRKKPDESLPVERILKIPNVDNVIEEGKKVPRKFRNIKLNKIDADFPAEVFTASGWPSTSIHALKILAGNVAAEFDLTTESGVEDNQSDGEESSVDQEPEKQQRDWGKLGYGTAMNAFQSEEEGREACHAIAALCEVCAIDSLISNFILPLQGSNISGKDDRIHCSLNINTETGRLSARRPNLQNQPALEKDRYKIRKAFIAAPGKSLIVADYGQLELRILAHLANCKSMLDAFKAGGDFHSRTALNMYPHIREAVDNGEVLLEWDPQPGEDKPPVPLLKDAFASERRKAKMLNFSIAYGKTPIGLARDWKVSVEEAKETVDLWYRDRQEVLKWQEKRKEEARKEGCVRTLMGRARVFPSMEGCSYGQRGHIERAAINTPVQGSAADVAMCAMLEISTNQTLKDLGWKLLLQVHDEVILEGPSESAEVAKDIVVDCMSKPFNGRNFLKVELAVDAKCAQNWYAAK